MKLKTKLMPLAILTVASGAIVPLSTACSNSSGLEMTNLNSLEEALPKFDQLATDSEWFDDANATDEYVALLKKNPNAFVEDMKWGIYQNWLSFYENSDFQVLDGSYPIFMFDSQLNSLRVGISEPKLSTVEIYAPGEGKDQDHEYNTISFKMRVDVDADVKTLDDGVVSYKNIKASTNVEYKNMIFYAFAASRDDKIPTEENTHEWFYNDAEVKPLNPNMDYDTTHPGWFITISDISGNQDLYDYNLEDWGITYDSSIVVDNTTIYGGQESHKVNTYAYADNVNSAQKLNDLVNQKSYSSISDYGVFDNGYWWNWFYQEPEQIIANSVLMDTVSHYFPDDVYSAPKLVSTDQSKDLVAPMYPYPYDNRSYFERPKFIPQTVINDPKQDPGHPDIPTWWLSEDEVRALETYDPIGLRANRHVRASQISFQNSSIIKLGEESPVKWDDGKGKHQGDDLVLDLNPNKKSDFVPVLTSDKSDFINPLYEFISNNVPSGILQAFEKALLSGNNIDTDGRRINGTIPNVRKIYINNKIETIPFTEIENPKISIKDEEESSLVPLKVGSLGVVDMEYDIERNFDLMLDNPIPSTFNIFSQMNKGLTSYLFWNLARTDNLWNFLDNSDSFYDYVRVFVPLVRSWYQTGELTSLDKSLTDFVENIVWQFDMPSCYFDTKWVREAWLNPYMESYETVYYDATKLPAMYFKLPSDTIAHAYLMWDEKYDKGKHNTEEYPDYPYFTMDFQLPYNEIKLSIQDVYGNNAQPVFESRHVINV